jgi:LmbE family N-acetylglucosaminyl deacetylase
MDKKHWIFLSPHFDDVALSCGGLVWDMVNQGNQVEVWTIMGGHPPNENFSDFARDIHQLWGNSGREAIDMRREEDRAACGILGAVPRYFDWPDVIYRRQPVLGTPVVNNDDELFHETPEPAVIEDITVKITKQLPQGINLVLPMGLGGHLDHRAVVQVGARLTQDHFYYADYPYILNNFDSPILTENRFQNNSQHLSQQALHAWQEAVLCYRSQLSTFWRDDEEARLALRNYLAGGGGRLWMKNE